MLLELVCSPGREVLWFRKPGVFCSNGLRYEMERDAISETKNALLFDYWSYGFRIGGNGLSLFVAFKLDFSVMKLAVCWQILFFLRGEFCDFLD